MAEVTGATFALGVMAEMFSTGKYSDLTIICKGQTFKVHRAVVCLQSKPMAAAVDGSWKEAKTGEIDLDDNEPEVVQKFLEFLYKGDYSDKESATKEEESSSASRLDGSLLLDVKLYIMGDKYDVQRLKALAKAKYETAVATEWNIDSSFSASLKLLYEETLDSDRFLKDIAMKTASDHAKELTDRGEFVSLCKENGEIAFDILKAWLNRATKACPHGHDQKGYSVSRQSDGRYYCTGGHFFH